VLRDGRPAARALVLSHTDQFDRLAATAPAAIPAAVVAGDPCYDRILASLPFRSRYRSALGVGERRLVYLSSTWSRESALGARFDLLRELLAELPRDTYCVATALHPNITHRHGRGQIRHWFGDCLRAGLVILPEIDGWRTGLIAADVVIGDNGSVTGYGAAIGRPTLLCAFPDVPETTPISELGRLAPRLPSSGPVLAHIESALAEHRPTRFAPLADRVSSLPGRSHQCLRDLFYRILDIPPPPSETPVAVLPAPVPRPPAPEFADVVISRVDTQTRTIRLSRHPAELQTTTGRSRLAGGHLCSTTDYPMRSLRERADVLLGRSADTAGDATTWLRHTLRDNPFCLIAAVVDDSGCRALTRSGQQIGLLTDDGPPDVLASLLYAWTEAGERLETLTPEVFVDIGRSRHRVIVSLD
jgi:hypothetical protein